MEKIAQEALQASERLIIMRKLSFMLFKEVLNGFSIRF